MKRHFWIDDTTLRAAALALIAMGLAGCSTVDDVVPDMPDMSWADPTSWFGSDAPPADAGPDLAGLPGRPEQVSADEQARVGTALAADRGQATYSADALRADTANTASVAPPEPASPAARVAALEAATAATPPAGALGNGPSAATPDQSAPAADNDLSASAPLTPLPDAPSAAPAARAAASDGQPAVPFDARPSGSVPMVTAAQVNPSDAQLGFKASSAPPLDASLSQWVAPQILSRYQQTARGAGVPIGSFAPRDVTASNSAPRAARATAIGGPERMSGAVVANLDAVSATPRVSGAVYGNPTAVVLFPGDGTTLSAAGRAQVALAVKAFNDAGGQGTVRVIGHASSRTANMPVEQHLMTIFQKSQNRANAVAQALIRAGVPAARVQVDAVGDSQPVYYESMPQGDEGNRRAEIFVQG